MFLVALALVVCAVCLYAAVNGADTEACGGTAAVWSGGTAVLVLVLVVVSLATDGVRRRNLAAEASLAHEPSVARVLSVDRRDGSMSFRDHKGRLCTADIVNPTDQEWFIKGNSVTCYRRAPLAHVHVKTLK